MSDTLKPETDVIMEVRRDHAEIRELFSQVAATHGAARREAFHALLRKIAIHETAEEMVVHPLARRAEGGDHTVDQRLAEEKSAERVLVRLQKMDVESPEFEAILWNLKQDVLSHAASEEQKEHPKIQQAISPERLQKLAVIYRAAEAVAPTRPHPDAPKSAVGSLVVGPLASIIDRTRDAIQDAMRKSD